MTLLIEQAAAEHGPECIRRLCSSCGLSRSSFYRYRTIAAGQIPASKRLSTEMALKSAIQNAAVDWSTYGYRRITAELRRKGWRVNRKRVLRLMREDNLLCLRRRRFVATTDSSHALPVYPNLASSMHVDGPDQLWVADITYIRLPTEFIYLAVILDAFSRRCVGWELGRRIDANLCIATLRMALDHRRPAPGLVHHSDRGVQYASKEYIDLLNRAGIRISMSRKGNPYDNAYAESFIKTLKYEEVYLNDYQNMKEARDAIAYFLEDVYNQKRLHSALDYMPPAEFERNHAQTAFLRRAVAQAATGQCLLQEPVV